MLPSDHFSPSFSALGLVAHFCNKKVKAKAHVTLFFPKKESACEGKSTHGIVDSEVDPSRFMDSHKDAYPLKT